VTGSGLKDVKSAIRAATGTTVPVPPSLDAVRDAMGRPDP
jgi:hypothetical protein